MRCRREVAVGDHACDATIDLLGKRLPAVTCSEASLDVADPCPGVMRAESCRHYSCRIALDEYPIWLFLEQDWLYFLQDCRSNLGRALVVLHDIQVVIGLNVEDAQHLVQHVAMLSGDAHATVDAVRVAGQLEDDRSEFDRFRPCPKHRQHL